MQSFGFEAPLEYIVINDNHNYFDQIIDLKYLDQTHFTLDC